MTWLLSICVHFWLIKKCDFDHERRAQLKPRELFDFCYIKIYREDKLINLRFYFQVTVEILFKINLLEIYLAACCLANSSFLFFISSGSLTRTRILSSLGIS